MTPDALRTARQSLGLTGTTDPIKAAYFAGLIDGEGCITIRRRVLKGTRGVEITPHVEVRMTCVLTITALANYFGGNVRDVKVAAGRKPQWRWRAASARARRVINEILPYLITKAVQARTVLDGSMPRKQNRTPENTRRPRAADGRFTHGAV